MPDLGYGQVPVNVIISGVRHTDFHPRDTDWLMKPKFSIIPGHAGVGVVVRLGEDAVTLKAGDRVGFAWLHDSSGGCDYGLSRRETVCGKENQTGFGPNGCFAEYALERSSLTVALAAAGAALGGTESETKRLGAELAHCKEMLSS